jgi:hypothetical protein
MLANSSVECSGLASSPKTNPWTRVCSAELALAFHKARCSSQLLGSFSEEVLNSLFELCYGGHQVLL